MRRLLAAVIAASSALSFALPSALRAQQTPVPFESGGPAAGPAPALQAVAPGLGVLRGTDAGSGITYTRLFLATGDPAAGASPGTGQELAPPDLQQPTLTAQCTQDRAGKLRFELFANFGGVTDPAFYPPWHSTPSDLYPPNTEKVTFILDFLGYRKVSPFKRQFERVLIPNGQYRYVPPGLHSGNMEEFAWFFQLLRALPSLRLTAGDKTVEFLTTPLLAQLSKEPLCKASGL